MEDLREMITVDKDKTSRDGKIPAVEIEMVKNNKVIIRIPLSHRRLSVTRNPLDNLSGVSEL